VIGHDPGWLAAPGDGGVKFARDPPPKIEASATAAKHSLATSSITIAT
jgi:hypothetical protein